MAIVLLLLGVGLSAIHFATAHNPLEHRNVLKQALAMSLGVGALGVLAFVDYRGFSRWVMALYWGNVTLLVIVLMLGSHASSKGAARWIKLPGGFSLQPSELAKFCVILTLSHYLARIGNRIKELPVLLRTLVHVALPMALIIKQPDLGTGLVIGAIWVGMTALAGAQWRHLLAILGASLAVFAIAWRFDTRGILIKPYHRNRVEALIYPNVDPQGIGYQIKQAKIAVGGGQLTGQGLGKGLQTNSEHVPENHTDMIFTVIAEETGMVGASVLLFFYLLLLWRALTIVVESEDFQGKLIAGGVASLIGFHVLVNIAMNTAMAPVVGVPLPFISYGGTAVIINLACIGLLLSARLCRRKIQFGA
jgi:rod shape determining protein RodA